MTARIVTAPLLAASILAGCASPPPDFGGIQFGVGKAEVSRKMAERGVTEARERSGPGDISDLDFSLPVGLVTILFIDDRSTAVLIDNYFQPHEFFPTLTAAECDERFESLADHLAKQYGPAGREDVVVETETDRSTTRIWQFPDYTVRAAEFVDHNGCGARSCHHLHREGRRSARAAGENR